MIQKLDSLADRPQAVEMSDQLLRRFPKFCGVGCSTLHRGCAPAAARGVGQARPGCSELPGRFACPSARRSRRRQNGAKTPIFLTTSFFRAFLQIRPKRLVMRVKQFDRKPVFQVCGVSQPRMLFLGTRKELFLQRSLEVRRANSHAIMTPLRGDFASNSGSDAISMMFAAVSAMRARCRSSALRARRLRRRSARA
jgi:hypothetical protein